MSELVAVTVNGLSRVEGFRPTSQRGLSSSNTRQRLGGRNAGAPGILGSLGRGASESFSAPPL